MRCTAKMKHNEKPIQVKKVHSKVFKEILTEWIEGDHFDFIAQSFADLKVMMSADRTLQQHQNISIGRKQNKQVK